MSLAIQKPPQINTKESQTAPAESWQDATRQIFPSVSAWLADMERCPDLASLWKGMLHDPSKLQEWLDRWIGDGRPEVAWPDSVASYRQRSECRWEMESCPEATPKG